jgi:CRP/FNR family transcriptional regulator, cyclic AMP receptor protein
MEDLDFTASAPARKSEIYDPAVARAFFEMVGKVENLEQGAALFIENQLGDNMYYVLEGEISIIRAKKNIDIVKAGEIVGELALLSQQPRNASAVARTPCRVIAFEGARFPAAIQRAPEFALMLMNIMINRLRLTIAQLAVTRSLPSSAVWRERRVFDERMLRDLVGRLRSRPPVHTAINKVIMKEGESGVFMYVVIEGRVAISIQSKVVERVGPGGIFGEMALVNQSPRAATATAESDCELLSISRTDFLELVKTNPAFGISLLRSLAERMNYMASGGTRN